MYHILERLTFFAVSAPGAEPYTALELQQLNLLPTASKGAPQPEPGGVAFSGDLAALYRANLHLRTANRVLVRLGSLRAIGFRELRKFASSLPWERYVTPGQPLALRVTCHKSRLYHSDAVAERVAAAAGDRLGKVPELQKYDEDGEDRSATAGTGPQLVVVRLLHDQCTISIDSSGDLLHRRGYRLATAKAPLRETLAAAMLLASGWKHGGGPPAPLVDPFCGSGTIAIEAAQMALGMAPGLGGEIEGRHFAFMNWPAYDAERWQELVNEARLAQQRQAALAAGTLYVEAADRDAGAIEAAIANAARAGVAEHIRFACRPVSALAAPASLSAQPGWIVTNPPYGMRVSGGQDVRNLYAQFGKVLRSSCPGWHLAVLCNERQLLNQMGLQLDTSLRLVNGGIPVMLAQGIVRS